MGMDQDLQTSNTLPLNFNVSRRRPRLLLPLVVFSSIAAAFPASVHDRGSYVPYTDFGFAMPECCKQADVSGA